MSDRGWTPAGTGVAHDLHAATAWRSVRPHTGGEAALVILVTGATGNVGRQVVSQLRAAGAGVRALTRDSDHAGDFR
ncbi:MAG: NmrA-like family [Chloroflexota bacterium]|nr:NmrA-like family [Chloroflexota bacterium]